MALSQQHWIHRAHQVLPAGGFGNFDPGVIIQRGDGAHVWDEDGREYIDLLIGSGPMLLGHGHPEVLEAVQEQLALGMTFFANNARAIELAEEICLSVPCAEQLRYVSTGGEADMYAIRLARAATGRDKILKYEGGYHGMSAEAQMSLMPTTEANFPQPIPDSAGIPASVRDHMLIAPFNDADYTRSLFDQFGSEIAAVIVEPLQRIVPPQSGFLKCLRELCSTHGSVLVFDEVVTGYRFDYGGAQTFYGVTPDLCTLGKVIGGGLPLAAIAGREDILRHFDKKQVDSEAWLMQIGTLSGNPLAAAAGLKTLEILRRPGEYARLFSLGERLMSSISKNLNQSGIAHQIVGHPTLFEVVFTQSDVQNYRDVLNADSHKAAHYNAVLRQQGVFKSPGKIYPSLALTEADMQQLFNAFAQAATAVEEI